MLEKEPQEEPTLSDRLRYIASPDLGVLDAAVGLEDPEAAHDSAAALFLSTTAGRAAVNHTVEAA